MKSCSLQVRPCLALVALCLCACGDVPPEPDVAPAYIELPTVGILGALPPRDGRVTIDVDQVGQLTVDGRPCAWDQFAARLDAAIHAPNAGPEDTQETPEEFEEIEITTEVPVAKPVEPVLDADAQRVWIKETVAMERQPEPRDTAATSDRGLSNVDVLLRVDRRVPWPVVVHILGTLVAPERMLWRVFYAVTGADGLGEGAIAVFLPRDLGCATKQYPELLDLERIRLRAEPGAAGYDVVNLASALLDRVPAPDSILMVAAYADSGTRHGELLLAMDAALRAGCAGFVLEGLNAPIEDIPALCAAAAAEPTPRHWIVSGHPIPSRPSPSPRAPERSDVYAGVVNNMLGGFDEPVIKDSER